ncbi:hypothetical protein DVH24_011967 [Malus domestica]|uniref:Reverse transcriptase zinc-binding domain-containing protein n=1 Tax=Malus domestica TaxID=3750 RepID=A0A498JGL5_MALDO|nr:hypothetical protein DVH24_011967 [Malus domestica]
MQCFLLPKTFCEELNRMIAKFWWSGEPSKKKIHWINWRTLCKPNTEGGLGFRDLTLQAWRFVQNPSHLFLDCCRSIAASRKVLMKGLRWQVGNGGTIKIWKDNWLPRDRFFKVVSPPSVPWNCEATFINPEEVDVILSISRSVRDTPDQEIWHFERNGKFSVDGSWVHSNNTDTVLTWPSAQSVRCEVLIQKASMLVRVG